MPQRSTFDLKTWRLTSLVFAIFLSLSFGIYLFSNYIHSSRQMGANLPQQNEYIVQYFTKVIGVSDLDAHTIGAANRVQLNKQADVRLKIDNRSDQRREFVIQISVNPQNEGIVLLLDPKQKYNLAAKESIVVTIPYLLKSDRIQSRDGTIDFSIHLSSVARIRDLQ